MGGALLRTGLDYCAASSYIDAMNVDDKRSLFLKIQIMESAAIQVFNAKR
jgi:hypothetical protein